MPKWKELKRFCDRDNWECYKVTDHYFYRKILPDGNILYTKVSKGNGEIEFSYGSEKVQIIEVQSVSWEKNGIHSHLMQMDGKLSADELVEMAQEVIEK